jgi:hypothetical protein
MAFSVGWDLSILKCCTNNIEIFFVSSLLCVLFVGTTWIMNYGWWIVNYGWCSFDWVTLQGKTPRMWYFSMLESGNSSCLFITVAMNTWFDFSLLAIRTQMIVFWEEEIMHNFLCWMGTHYFFASIFLSSLKNQILASAIMRGDNIADTATSRAKKSESPLPRPLRGW